MTLAILLFFSATACFEEVNGTDGDDGVNTDPSAVVSVNVLPVTATITVGLSREFSTDLRDASGQPVVAETVEWAINDASIATVSPTGVVSGVSPGVATLAATVNGITGTATVTVIPPQTSQGDTIALTIRRLDGGAGQTLVSSGIPLPPGFLRDGQMDQFVLFAGGQEQSIYIEPLISKHPDGSIRSVLVQFNTSVPTSSPVSGFALVGSGVSRNAPDIAKTEVTWSTPSAVALPTSPEYLASTLIVGPTVSINELPSGYFQQWQSDFVSVGQERWNNDDLTVSAFHQYDRALTWFAGWARTGDPLFWERGNKNVIDYITLQENADPQYWLNLLYADVGSSEVHYLLTGDLRGWRVVRGVAEFIDETQFRDALDRDPFKEWMDSRIQSYVLMSAITAARLEVPGKDWAAQAREDLDDIFTTQGADGAIRWFSWDDEHSVYMGSLLLHALIKYYTWFEPDPRIPPFVKKTLDFVHPNLWLGDSWYYASGDPTNSPDLNQLNAVAYAWYGWLSGDQAYTEIAKSAFQFGVTESYLQFKQFNQAYRGSFQTAYYILNR